MSKKSLAEVTLKIAKEQEEERKRLENKEKILAKKIYKEVKKKLKNGNFTSRKSDFDGAYIISVKLKKVHNYDKKVDEELFVAGFSLAWLSFSTFASASAFSLFAFAGSGWRKYFWCIGVVCEEFAELHTYDLLYDVFFVDIFEISVYVGHERFNFLLVYISLYYLVHYFVELFLADFLRCRYLPLYEVFLYHFLYGTHLTAFTGVDDGYRCSVLAGASSSSASVGIAFRVVRQSVVYHVRQVVNIKSTCSHVSCHE